MSYNISRMSINTNRTGGFTPPFIIAAFATAIYLISLANGFVYDDHFLIESNSWIEGLRIYDIFTRSEWSFASGESPINYYRPFFYIFHALSYNIFGPEAWGFHLSALLLNAFNAVLVYYLARVIVPVTKGISSDENITWAAFLGALIFAAHPVHTECVAWASAVADPLVTCFVLLSLLVYIRKETKACASLLSPTFFLFALFSKETAIALPFFIVLYDLLIERRLRLKGYLPFVVVALVYFALRLNALGGMAPEELSYTTMTGYEKLINILPLLARYIFTLFVPLKLSIFQDFHPITSLFGFKGILSILFSIGLILVMLALLIRNRVALFLLFMTLLPLGPALYIPALGREVFAERYLYMPSAGFAILISLVILYLFNRSQGLKRPVIIIAFAVSAIFAVATILRLPAWKNDYTIWLDASIKTPNRGYPHMMLGPELTKRGEFDLSEKSLKRGIELGLLEPDLRMALYNLGNLYMKKEEPNSALKAYEEARALGHPSTKLLYALGAAYEEKSLLDEALIVYENGLLKSPGDPDMHAAVGRVHRKNGRLKEARLHYETAVSLHGESAEYRNNLGVIYAMLGQVKKAEAEFRAALKADPKQEDARRNLERLKKESF